MLVQNTRGGPRAFDYKPLMLSMQLLSHGEHRRDERGIRNSRRSQINKMRSDNPKVDGALYRPTALQRAALQAADDSRFTE